MPLGLQVAKLWAKYKVEENVMMKNPGITITGASGRMGKMLVKEVLESKSARLVGAVERVGHAWVGLDLGEAMGGSANGIIVTDDPLKAFALSQAIIDFTAPNATIEFAALAAQARAVHVIGTTGMTDQEIAALEPASLRSERGVWFHCNVHASMGHDPA